MARSATVAVNSVTSLDLPPPASAPVSTVRGVPPAASSNAPASSMSSASRPAKTGLTKPAAMSLMMPVRVPGRRRGATRSGRQVPDEAHPVLPGTVVAGGYGNVAHVGVAGLEPEPHPAVEGDRAGVHRRGHGAHARAAPGPHRVEERAVQPPPESLAPLLRVNADEMDIGLARLRRRHEPHQETGQRAVAVRGEAGVGEVVEEQPGQHLGHGAATPPLVDHRDHRSMVGRAERPDPRLGGHRRAWLTARRCIPASLSQMIADVATSGGLWIRFLSGPDIDSLGLSNAEIIDAVEGAVRAHGDGHVVVEPRVHLVPDNDGAGHFNVLRGAVGGVAGTKVVGDFVANYAVGLPSELGLLTLYDPGTGVPLAIIDATLITACRTGAMTAVGARYLARPDSRVLRHVGARGTAFWNIVLLAVLFDREGIRVACRVTEAREAFGRELAAIARAPVRVAATADEVFDGADILVVASRLPVPQPLLRTAAVKAGAF